MNFDKMTRRPTESSLFLLRKEKQTTVRNEPRVRNNFAQPIFDEKNKQKNEREKFSSNVLVSGSYQTKLKTQNLSNIDNRRKIFNLRNRSFCFSCFLGHIE